MLHLGSKYWVSLITWATYHFCIWLLQKFNFTRWGVSGNNWTSINILIDTHTSANIYPATSKLLLSRPSYTVRPCSYKCDLIYDYMYIIIYAIGPFNFNAPSILEISGIFMRGVLEVRTPHDPNFIKIIFITRIIF